jgi:hypothetical protein
MAQDFRILIAGPAQKIATILIAVERRLGEMGFRRDRTVSRAELEPTATGEDEEESLEISSLTSEAGALEGWNGAAIEWGCRTFSMNFHVVRWADGFINGYITINMKVLSRLYADEAVDRFYGAVAAIAGVCRATGGLGEMDLPFEKVKPSETREAFLNNPAIPGCSCTLGLFPRATTSREAVEAIAREEFTIGVHGDFWLVEEKEFVELGRQYG